MFPRVPPHRRTCAVLLAWVGWGCALVRGAAAPDVAGTLPEHHLPALRELLETAGRRSPQLLAQDLERILAGIRIQGTDAQRLPNFGGGLSYAINQTAISSNASSQTRDRGGFYNLGVTQPLYHWGALQNQSASARINALIAQKAFAQAARDLRVVIRRAFLGLVAEKARVAAAADVVRLAAAEVAVLEEKKARGVASAAALEGEKLRLREVRLDHDRLAAEFEANRGRLARLAGVPELPAAAIPAALPAQLPSAELAAAVAASALRDGARSTLEYEIHGLRLRDALLRHEIEKVRLRPKIYLNAGVSLENSTNVNNNAVSQEGVQRRTVSIFAQWSIFDGFATRAAVRETVAARRAQERRAETEIETLLGNIQSLERGLRLDAEQVALAEIRLGIATEGSRVIAREVELGNAPRGDLERSRAGILQAEIRLQESRALLWSRWAELVALAGAEPNP
ncbi:MAG: TolC family protein [Opitutaceae bacterium]